MIAAFVAFAIPTCHVTIGSPRDFPASGSETWTFERVTAPIDVDEAVPSWNVKNGENAALFVEVRVRDGQAASAWLPFARWTLDETRAERTSLKTPKDPMVRIDTDTLLLPKPLRTFDFRVTATTLGEGKRPRLTHFALAGSRGRPSSGDVDVLAPTGPLPVPERAQGDYPNGGVLCSPTSLSMVLNHFRLPVDTPEVQQAVFDPEYGGTGNWTFNAAYAGSRDGLRSTVARLRSAGELSPWLAAGVPPILSVSLDLLKGKEKDNGGGHLVVLVGFDANGDPIMNDPAWRGAVRRTYKRADFERAWAFSKHTVYLVWPEDRSVPDL